MQLLLIGLLIHRTIYCIARLDFPEQDVLKLNSLVRIKIEKTSSVDQVEEHLWQMVLERNSPFFS